MSVGAVSDGPLYQPDGPPPVEEVIIDWEAYFVEFSKKHGGFPVVYAGRLLFQDGWRYSLKEQDGPEWPPPKDPDALSRLQTIYWMIRRSINLAELMELRQKEEGLRNLQESLSAPLQCQTVVWDDDGNPDMLTQELTFDAITGRRLWVEMDLDECEKRLKERNRREPDGERNQEADSDLRQPRGAQGA